MTDTSAPRLDDAQPAVSFATICMILLSVVFVVAACARLNELHYYDPDSADYVIQSRAIAEGRGYVHTELPGSPPQTIRPPGLSLLLIPSQIARPYSTIAAKLVVIITSTLLVWLVYSLASRGGSRWVAFIMAAAVATSPYTLFFATEVLSEAPYTAATLAILLLLDTRDRQLAGWRFWAAFSLLGFLPLLRSVGLMMVLAVGVWAVAARRWRWMIPVAAGLGAQLWWSMVSGESGATSYLSRLGQETATSGILGMLLRALQGAMYHGENLLEHLLPVGAVGNPYYWFLMLDGAKPLGVPAAMAAIIAAALLVYGLAGLARRGSPAAAVGLLYSLFYFGCISVWPFRQERFVWPLIPILFAALGWRLASILQNRVPAPVKRTVGIGIIVLMVPLVAWHCREDAHILIANLSLCSNREAFYGDQFPSAYYRDWPSAGRWIAANYPAQTRLLTHRATLACTAHRYQQLGRFESASPQQIHAKLARFHASLIVIAGTRSPQLFPWHLLEQDPVYRYELVYEDGDVAILSLSPNRSGRVHSHTVRPLDTWIETMQAAVKRHPDRYDLQVALGQALLASERYDDVIRVVQKILDDGIRQPGPYLLMGHALRVQQRYDEALYYLRQGELLADLGLGVRRSLLEEIQRVQTAIQNREPKPVDAMEPKIANARFHAEQFDFQKAWQLLRELPPGNEEVHLLRAEVLMRLGHEQEAEAEYVAASKLGSAEAETAIRLLRLERTMVRAEETGEVATEELLLELAHGLTEQGVPGKALAILEQHADEHEDSAAYLLELAKLQRFYVQLDMAEQTLRKAEKLAPRNADVSEALATVARLRQSAQF